MLGETLLGRRHLSRGLKEVGVLANGGRDFQTPKQPALRPGGGRLSGKSEGQQGAPVVGLGGGEWEEVTGSSQGVLGGGLMGRGRAVALFSELDEIQKEVIECSFLICLLSCHFTGK